MKKKEKQDNMDIQKYNRLNSLKNKRNNLINEQTKLNKRPLLGKQIGFYVIGLYAITIISLLIFSRITLISVLLPSLFALFTPIVMKNKNKKKIEEIKIEIKNLNNQILVAEKDLKKESICIYQTEKNKKTASVNIKSNVELFRTYTDENDGPKLVLTKK